LARAVAATARRRSRGFPARAWVLPAAAGLLVGLALAGYRARSIRADALAAELAGSHVRALQPGKLTDVVSTDRHTVKPWFAGRIDFAPPVPDLTPAGFPLVGGRLDAVAGRPAAVLVYGRRRHVIDLYVVPAADSPGAVAAEWNGFHVVHWTAESLAFWAISDLDRAELQRFVSLFRGAAS
ncbi:MAG TPA: anti-sigma factor, partial [Thermoanaerobaculia bacterium]|nr:anti-sigma factor [Thermoanaerobaculia bacterium]